MSDAATLAAHGAERPAHADSGATAPVDSGSLQRAGSAGTVQAGDGASPGPEGPIHAYAKLEFPGFSYYIQTLEVTIGRRPAQPPGGEATAQGSSARRPHGEVDVDLGPLKSISRLHARIYYTVQPELYHAPGFAYTPLPSSLPGTSPGGTNERGEGQGRFVLEVLGRNGAFVDDVWVNAHGVVPLGRRTKIQIAERVFYFVLPPPTSASEAESEADESAEQTDASSEAAAHDTSSELSDAETHDAARIRDDTASVSPSAHRLVLKPRSKVTGKKREASADVPLAEDAKRRKEEPDAARKGKDKEERAVTPSSLSALAAAATQVGADSPEEKPQLGNVELITQALSSELCRSKGGKLTLQEVYEWLQSTYPWFSRNGRKTGRDWQSSIRHTIGTSRDFTKIPRRPDEHGKGIFYTLSTSELAQAQDAQRQPLPANVPEKSPSPPSAPDTQPTAAASSGDAAKPAAKEAAPAGMPRIPLVVGIPPGAQQHAAEQKAKGAPGSIESLLETPPIAHHQGKLYLSPNVFGHLTSAQLRHMEGLGAQQALQVLQSYLVNHLKERLKKPAPGAGASATGAPSNGSAAPSATAAPAGPSTNTAAARQPAYDPHLSLPAVPQIPVSKRYEAPAPNTAAPPAAAPPAAAAPAPAPAATAAPAAAAPAAAAPAPAPAPGPSNIPPPKQSTPSREHAEEDDPLSALSALASHPEAAGLISLLKQQQAGQAGGTVKLTPGQLELLQLANRLAAAQKKKKKAGGPPSDSKPPPPESRPPQD